MKHLLLDCDDVLLDWIGGFRRYSEAVLHRPLDEEGPHDWLMGRWLGVSEEEARAMVADFNNGPLFGALSPVPGAVESVFLARRAGYTVSVITSCSTSDAVQKARHDNLRDHFDGTIQDIHCLDFGVSKLPLLRSYPKGVWVEDNYKHALSGVQAGHTTFLRRRPHNATLESTSHHAIQWVDEWPEIVERIIQED